MITKTLEEKLDDEERTEEQKCEVFKQILEVLNYYNDETNTDNSNQLKQTLVILRLLVNMIKQAELTEICHHSYVS